MKKILFFLFLFSSPFIWGQNNSLDSLWEVYHNKANADTNRLKAIYAISKNYTEKKPDTAIILAKQQLQLAQISRQKKYEARANNILGIAFMYKENYPKSLEYYFKSLNINEEIGNKRGIGFCFYNISGIYKKQGNNSKALEYILKDAKISEELGDKSDLADSYLNIGNVCWEQSNLIKSFEYYFKSLKLYEELSDQTGIRKCYAGIGIIYMQQLNYPKALEYMQKSLKIAKELGDKLGASNMYMNIGIIFNKQSAYLKALECFTEALKIKKEIGSLDKEGISKCYTNSGIVYQMLSNNAKALECFTESNKISKAIGDISTESKNYLNISASNINMKKYGVAMSNLKKAGDLCIITGDIFTHSQVYHNMASCFQQLNNYKKAYENQIKFKELTDSIFNAENSKQIGDFKTNFEVEKKAAELKAISDAQEIINNEEKKRQKVITWAVVCGLILVFIFSLFIFNRLRITRRQKNIIEEQKAIVEKQKHLVEEHQKEIIDSINYAERIQRSFIATKEILNENFNNYFVLFKPKDIVSGDFYWASKLNNDNFALVTADSTGHGVPGAIMSLLNVTSLEKAIESHSDPADILNATREIIIERLKKDGSAEGGKDGMDASLTVYDFKNKKLIIAAANNPVWIVRGNETIELKPDKMPVGKHDNQSISFTQQEIDLQHGDVIYTLTDGFPDQFGGEKGKKFMSKNLKKMLSVNAHLPMQEQKELLEKTFKSWVGNLEQVDDVTLIGVRI